jgi:hypothetical protein
MTTYYEMDWYGCAPSADPADLYGTQPDACFLVTDDEEGNELDRRHADPPNWAEAVAVDWSSDQELNRSVNYTARVRLADEEDER